MSASQFRPSSSVFRRRVAVAVLIVGLGVVGVFVVSAQMTSTTPPRTATSPVLPTTSTTPIDPAATVDAAAESSVRNAASIATAYFNVHRSFAGFKTASLLGASTGQRLFSPTEPTGDMMTPGPRADPRAVAIGDGVGIDSPTGEKATAITLAAISKGTTWFCTRISGETGSPVLSSRSGTGHFTPHDCSR
jgi:hypothetical protein